MAQAKNLPSQIKSLAVVGGDEEEHPGEFHQHNRNYHLCVPLSISDHTDHEVSECFLHLSRAALLQEQVSCYVCSEIPICMPCIVCESTGKTFVNDWCCSCCNANNVKGVVTDEEFKELTKRRYQAVATSQEDFDSKDGDVREKYIPAQCAKEFFLNCPCITFFTNFPFTVNLCYPLRKAPDGSRMGSPLMEYKCIMWLCKHPTKVFCPPCVGCVKPWRHCIYTCDEAPANENPAHIMDGEPKCMYCVPNHVWSSPMTSIAAFTCPCFANAYNMEQIFMYNPVSLTDLETGERRLPLWNHGSMAEEYDAQGNPSGHTQLRRRVACLAYTLLCCTVPLVGHAITRTQVQKALFPVEKNVNNVLKHKNCIGNLCCDVLFPCCATAQETYAIQLAEQYYANSEDHPSTWKETTKCQCGQGVTDDGVPQEMEMTKRNE